MAGYLDSIAEACQCNLQDAKQVEHIMREERPTLDALTRPEFDRLARRSGLIHKGRKRAALSIEVEMPLAKVDAFPIWSACDMEGVYEAGVEKLCGVGYLSLRASEYAIRWVACKMAGASKRAVEVAIREAKVARATGEAKSASKRKAR